MDGKLTDRQQRFVEEYLRDLNATRAYKAAGYRVKSDEVAAANASRLLTNARIVDFIERARSVLSAKAGIDHKWVLDRLVRNVKRAASAVPVNDREGKPTGEYRYEGNVVNRGLELIGKHLGMFPDQVKVSGDADNPAELIVRILGAGAGMGDLHGGRLNGYATAGPTN